MNEQMNVDFFSYLRNGLVHVFKLLANSIRFWILILQFSEKQIENNKYWYYMIGTLMKFIYMFTWSTVIEIVWEMYLPFKK